MADLDVKTMRGPETKKPRVVLTYDSTEELGEIEAYAQAKGLDVKSLHKFTLRQYMDRYPAKAGGRPKGVHPQPNKAPLDEGSSAIGASDDTE